MLPGVPDDPKQPYQARMKAGEQILKAAYRIREMEARLVKPASDADGYGEGSKKAAEEAEAPRVDVSEALSNIQTMLGEQQAAEQQGEGA